MKAVLEFELPEDKEAFEWASNAYTYVEKVDEVKELLRHADKGWIFENSSTDLKRLDDFIERLRRIVYQ